MAILFFGDNVETTLGLVQSIFQSALSDGNKHFQSGINSNFGDGVGQKKSWEDTKHFTLEDLDKPNPNIRPRKTNLVTSMFIGPTLDEIVRDCVLDSLYVALFKYVFQHGDVPQAKIVEIIFEFSRTQDIEALGHFRKDI